MSLLQILNSVLIIEGAGVAVGSVFTGYLNFFFRFLLRKIAWVIRNGLSALTYIFKVSLITVSTGFTVLAIFLHLDFCVYFFFIPSGLFKNKKYWFTTCLWISKKWLPTIIESYLAIKVIWWKYQVLCTMFGLTLFYFTTKNNQHVWQKIHFFSFNFEIPLLLNSCFWVLGLAQLPPTPDDPLYTDHSIWEKCVKDPRVLTPEEIKAAEEAKLLEQKEQQELAAECQEELQRDEDVNDALLFTILCWIMVIAHDVYVRLTKGK